MRGDQRTRRPPPAGLRLEVEEAECRRRRARLFDGRAFGFLAMIDARPERRGRSCSRKPNVLSSWKPENLAPQIRRLWFAIWPSFMRGTGSPILQFDVGSLVNRPAGTNPPAQPTYGDFRRNPLWDPLWNDPRFAAIMEGCAGGFEII